MASDGGAEGATGAWARTAEMIETTRNSGVSQSEEEGEEEEEEKEQDDNSNILDHDVN